MGDVFDSVIDREARRVLFIALQTTYHFVRVFKFAKFDGITESVAAYFELSSRRKTAKMARSIKMVVTPYFQAYHGVFSKNRFQNDEADADEFEANVDGARDDNVLTMDR